MSTLEDWVNTAAAELGLGDGVMSTSLRNELLDVTRVVAHGVARPAGPLTTYLIGLAVGAGMEPADAIRRLTELVPEPEPSPDPQA